jgi:hypothetical protein
MPLNPGALLLRLVFPEKHADVQLNRVEGLRPDALASLRRQDFNVAIWPPTMHSYGLLRGVDNPIVRDLALMVGALLFDEVVAPVR